MCVCHLGGLVYRPTLRCHPLFLKHFAFFFQVTLGLSEGMDETRPEDIDLLILRNVRRTAGRSKHLMGELKGLKAKVYGLENDLRHL